MHEAISSPITVSESIPRSPSRVPPASPTDRRQSILIRGAGLIACLDSLVAVIALVAVLISVNLSDIPGGVDSFLSARITVKNILLVLLLATAWPIVFHLFGLYRARRVRRLESEAGRLVAATATGSGMALLFPLTSVTGAVTVWDVPHFWLASLTLSLLVRTGRRAVDRARHRHAPRALIIGTGRLARRAQRDMSLDRTRRYEMVGFVDEVVNGGPPYDRVPEQTIGTLEQLEQILMRQIIDEVVIALPVKSCYQQIQYVIGVCERVGVQAKYAVDIFESTVAFPRYDAQGDRALVAMQVVPDGYELVVKRVIDIVGAAVGLAIFLPVMLMVAAAIRLTSSGRSIYAQQRCGLNRRPFRMYKFRSMYADAEKLQASLEVRNEASGPVFKIRNDPRITPLGRLLRKSSLDELPQLFNVLRGDMSLVGPRPLPWRDVERIIRPSDMRRFSMRPGLTCLWQVQGRNNIDFDRWVELDLEYIDNWSLASDGRILIKTIPAVLSGNGAA
jgi:exopolysaccharide biosynthesis polyprenyl glycosylphosphotransferase